MRGFKKFLSFGFSVGLFLAAALVWFEKQAVYDWYRLRNYQPTAQIAQLATDASMNDDARRVYYVQYPLIDERQSFNEHCKVGEQTIVLGCYVSRAGIYILKVDDPRLQGIEQVTAAHEMLHAAYERLSKSDELKVRQQLIDAYAKITDPRLQATIKQYKDSGADEVNELHSILGTEVRDLPAELEDYYHRYFADRKKVVSYSEQYEKAFSELKDKVANYDKQLSTLKVQIDEHQADLTQRSGAIEGKKAQLDGLLAAKQISTYNVGVPIYNGMIAEYNVRVADTRGLIDDYNHTLELRNSVAVEEQKLYKAIDSRPEAHKSSLN